MAVALSDQHVVDLPPHVETTGVVEADLDVRLTCRLRDRDLQPGRTDRGRVVLPHG